MRSSSLLHGRRLGLAPKNSILMTKLYRHPCSAFHWVMLGFKFLRVNNSQSKATRISVGLRHQYGISRVQSQSSPEAEERLTQRKTPELGFCYNISL